MKPHKRPRGRPPLENPKQQVSIRLDPDVLAYFRADGLRWQTRINAILRRAMLREQGRG